MCGNLTRALGRRVNTSHDSSIDDPATALLSRSFLLGTARHPIPRGAAFAEFECEGGAMSDLASLALLGQRPHRVLPDIT